jgi:hypothetical protein
MAPSESKSKSIDESDEKVGAESSAWTETQTATVTQPGEPALYVKDLDYTAEEETAVIRILDTRLFPWILLTTFVLNMDRTNLSNAISDNLPADLGFTINTVNTGTAIYAVVFSLSCLYVLPPCQILRTNFLAPEL